MHRPAEGAATGGRPVGGTAAQGEGDILRHERPSAEQETLRSPHHQTRSRHYAFC